ncbi:MAG: ABC transporter permease [Chromatiales bacterium]|jgi:putative spermidine/putrescine transport system permease protein|nr:ABC transporter permease [Chromatiales bacterium]
MAHPSRRTGSFFALVAFFAIFVVFLYGPMFAVVVLSFQGVDGGLTFPMRGFSLHWFGNLFEEQMVGDFEGSFARSFVLALIVTALTVVISLAAGLAFRRPFKGAGILFYLTVASLIVPSILITLGIGLMFDRADWEPTWYSSGMGAHLTWTLPFGLLIMFAVFNRFDKSYEEAARDLGASPWQVLRHVVLPIIAPSLVGVGLFGFTLSFDEFARTLMAAGVHNTLPLEIFGMTTNVTTPVLYALGTVTTGVSFAIIGICLGAITWVQRRRLRHGTDAGSGLV